MAYRLLLGFFSLISLLPARQESAKQPVFIFLYARMGDHINREYTEERLNRLLPALEKYSKAYSKYRPTVVFQFTGAVSQLLEDMNSQNPIADSIRDFTKRDLIEVGYNGHDEPTYRNRPGLAEIRNAKTAEELWLAKGQAANRFLAEYKHPSTGDPDPKRPGGLVEMQKVFGKASYITWLTEQIGGDSATIHWLRKYNEGAMLLGVPDPDSSRGIHGYRGSAEGFGKTLMSPLPNTSPLLYWENNFLRSSETSDAAVRVFSADEGPEALKAAFEKLDRSKVQIVHVEFGSYKRYLNVNGDGLPRYDPIVWAYDHAYEPRMRTGVPAFLTRPFIDASYQKEDQSIQWLAEQFFPANPGSRFVSVADLKKMADSPVGKAISQDELKAAVADLLQGYAATPFTPNYAGAGDQFFSLADMFQLLAKSLAGTKPGGQLPQSVKLENVYGPVEMLQDRGPVAQVTAGGILKAATLLAPRFTNPVWKPIPSNAVPPSVLVEGTKLTASQFLRLMAEVWQDPSPTRKLQVRPVDALSSAGMFYPHMVKAIEQGNTWTFRPAPLHLD